MDRGIKEILLLGLVVLLLLGIAGSMVGFGVWASFAALEDRFGSGVATLVFGGMFVVAAWVGGSIFTARQNRQAQTAFLQGLGELGDVLRGTAGVQREQLRGEREAFKATAGAMLYNERRINQVADQKARLLVDAQRNAPAAPTWYTVADEREADPLFDPDSAQSMRAEVPAAPVRAQRAERPKYRYVE